MRTRDRFRGVVFVFAVLLAPAMLGANCVDGTTPDCSDAAAQCGPSASATTTIDAVAPPADAQSDADETDDAAADGAGLGDPDGGDEN